MTTKVAVRRQMVKEDGKYPNKGRVSCVQSLHPDFSVTLCTCFEKKHGSKHFTLTSLIHSVTVTGQRPKTRTELPKMTWQTFGLVLIHSLPSMALQPLLGPGLLQKTPQFFSPARLLHPVIPRICDVSLRTTSSHLFLLFPLVLYYEISINKLFWVPFIYHSYNMTWPS
jgi:hypothetical protein